MPSTEFAFAAMAAFVALSAVPAWVAFAASVSSGTSGDSGDIVATTGNATVGTDVHGHELRDELLHGHLGGRRARC